ncbi:MAG: BatA and WFA domain-containing protein [Planctomycetota bacterium]
MNILDFANPINFWWAAIALPIIALYILKVRLRRMPASTLLFWNKLFDEKKPRSWWQRLRHWLSLALQLIILAAVVSALVDPLWSWQKEKQRRLVLVLDNSASMQATNSDGQTRLEAAKQAATAIVRSLRDGDQMAIVAAGGRPEVIWGMTNHQRWLTDALEATDATDAPAAIEESMELASRLLSGLEGEGETIVLTDGCSPGIEGWEEREDLQVLGVGESTDNIGITRYQVRRSLIDAIGYQVLVDVTNYSDEPSECRLELDLDGSLIDVLPLRLEPNETLTRIVNHTSAAGGTMNAKLDANDALTVDNAAQAILPTRNKIPITLYSEGNLFLASVLNSIPLVDLTIQADYQPGGKQAAIHVFDKKLPDELPAGPVLVVDPQQKSQYFEVGDEIDQPIVAKVDTDSPLAQHMRLDNVLFPGAKRLEFAESVQNNVKMLIQDPYDAPLLAQIRRSSGDVVVLTCSLEKGDLPLRIAFPVLIKNTVEWFQGESGQLRPAASAGEMIAIRIDAIAAAGSTNSADVTAETPNEDLTIIESSLPEDQKEYELLAPDGSTSPVAVGDSMATIGPLLEAGVWQLRPVAAEIQKEDSENAEVADSGNSPREDSELTSDAIPIACNLVSSVESDLRPKVELPQAKELDGMVLGGRSIWFYLTMLALCLIAIEWWLYQRRIVG